MTEARSDVEMQSRHTNTSSEISDQSHPVDDSHMDRSSMEDAQPVDLSGYGRLHPGYDRQGIGGGAMLPARHTPTSTATCLDMQDCRLGSYRRARPASTTAPAFGGSTARWTDIPWKDTHGWRSVSWLGDANVIAAWGPVPDTGSSQPQLPPRQPTISCPRTFGSPFGGNNTDHTGLRPGRSLFLFLLVRPDAPNVAVRARVRLQETGLSAPNPAQEVPAGAPGQHAVGGCPDKRRPAPDKLTVARTKICQRLLDLTVRLLKPLIHTPMGESYSASNAAMGAVGLGGLGVAMPGSVSMDALTGEYGAFGAAGHFDDVATYAHLATVVSASEYKGASMRWWNAAWSLARELKLGRELPPNEPRPSHERNEAELDGPDEHDACRNRPGLVTEEEREERRRIWWLVYIVDRHLALCYNRPLFLLDVECAGLLQPMNDTAWQRGDFKSCSEGNADPAALRPVSQGFGAPSTRVSGSQFECRGHSIFGYFLPLMTILGEIVDLHHAKNHPIFGIGFRGAHEWDEQAAEIRRHLEVYEGSLEAFRGTLPSKASRGEPQRRPGP